MIISLEEAKIFNPKVTQEWLDGIESTIREVTNNNFQRRAVRLKDVTLKNDTVTSQSRFIGFKQGQTIQVSDSIYNDGLYVVKDVSKNSLTVAGHIFTNADILGAFVTLVIYPPDIVSGVIEMLRYDDKMVDKVGVKSEKISRYSVTYAELQGRYPDSLLSFLDTHMRLRWS